MGLVPSVARKLVGKIAWLMCEGDQMFALDLRDIEQIRDIWAKEVGGSVAVIHEAHARVKKSRRQLSGRAILTAQALLNSTNEKAPMSGGLVGILAERGDSPTFRRPLNRLQAIPFESPA